jgi:hypothetical protein
MMIPGKISNALKGVGGEFELNRIVGFFGGISYVIGTHVFVGYDVFCVGKAFDITSYCLAFPSGLAVVAGGTAAAISLKDRNVASSKVIEQTGAVPAPPLDGPRVPLGDPPPVDQPKPAPAEEGIPDYAR